MALVASATGNWMVKFPFVDVLSPPKASTATDLLDWLLLYIRAPFAVMVEADQVVSLKSVKAVVPDEVGATLVSVLPPAVYPPVEATSFDVVYAVVVASRLADEV